MSLYADYIKEREGREVIENSIGFVAFKIIDNECYLADMYIVPDSRRGLAVKHFIDQLAKEASGRGCEYITARLHDNDPNRNRTLRAALKLDFNIFRSETGCIVIAKKLEQ